MKVLLERAGGLDLEARSWVELAFWDQGRLYGFLPQGSGAKTPSCREPHFGPEGEVYFLHEDAESLSEYPTWHLRQTHLSDDQTTRDTFKFGFQPSGQLVSLQAESPDQPYGVVWGDPQGPVQPLNSSATHLELRPQSEEWWVSTLDRLYRGGSEALRDVGPTPARRFTLTPHSLVWCQGAELWQRPVDADRAEILFRAPEGQLLRPCWTPQGIFVSEEESQPCRLWRLSESGEAQLVWQGEGERLYLNHFFVAEDPHA